MRTELNDELFDVIIVGYGPVGRMLALQLGRAGHRVLVVERQQEIYFLPRAVHLDDEIGRVLQSIGVPPDAMPEAIEPYDDFYEWRAADGRTLTRLDWRGRGPSGWNVSNFFNQPSLERALHARVGRLVTVTVAMGLRATARTEEVDQVRLELTDSQGGLHSVRGRYVIGADGANSIVRQWIGAAETDLGYFHDWLVVDLVMPTDGAAFHPAAWQLCDPKRPTTLVPGGPGRRRFEFMRLPGETAEVLSSVSAAWRLLEPWGIGPDSATLERNTLYTFQARWADSWQRDRLFIAGDAAHLMPPFAGQGMCSGLRDAANLSWKLDLVLTGRSTPAVLDDYTSERVEHVRHFIAASMALGEVICITDEGEAAERDSALSAEFRDGVQPPPRPLPRLGAGLHRDDGGGGLLSIQAVVDAGSGPQRFDDATGAAAVLLVQSASLAEALAPGAAAHLGELGVSVVALGPAPTAGVVVDTDGEYGRWFDSLGACAALIRPDFYVFGVAEDAAGLVRLADDYLERVGAVATTERDR